MTTLSEAGRMTDGATGRVAMLFLQVMMTALLGWAAMAISYGNGQLNQQNATLHEHTQQFADLNEAMRERNADEDRRIAELSTQIEQLRATVSDLSLNDARLNAKVFGPNMGRQ